KMSEVALVENIALLSYLNKTPILPKAYDLPSVQTHQYPERRLSLKREADLAKTIAFLAGISDDSQHVVATCIEELPAEKGTRVLIAINKLDHSSGEVTLQQIQAGLEEIFGLLSKVNTENDTLLENKVLDAIVEMCQNRILSRMGSRRVDVGLAKSRNPIGSVFQSVIATIREHFSGQNSRPETKSLISKANELLSFINQHELCRKDTLGSQLKRIIVTTSQLTETFDLPGILSGIPSQKLQPDTGKGVVRRLGKLARYREYSQYLFKLAKKTHLFKNVEVVPISLPPECFKRSQMLSADCCLKKRLLECQRGVAQPAGAKTVCRKLGVSLAEGTKAFKSAVKVVVNESKIHAEVLIVAYYELHPTANKPRVICSNKDVCYLCDLLFRSHGQFHIPSTHGRLYHGWRLPNIPAFKKLRPQLNSFLEWDIRTAISETMSASKPIATHFPNESTLFPILSSTSTLASAIIQDLLEKQPLVTETPVAEAEKVSINEEPLAKAPSVMELPIEEPPVEEPSSEEPSSEEPSTEEPHVKEPFDGDPSIREPPVQEPPIHEPPLQEPPISDLPTGAPPAQEPPAPARPVQDPSPTDPSPPQPRPSKLAASMDPPVHRRSVKDILSKSPFARKSSLTHPSTSTLSIRPRNNPPTTNPSPASQKKLAEPTNTTTTTTTTTVHLLRGRPATLRLDIPSKTEHIYTTGQITIHPEFVRHRRGRKSGPVGMTIHWLLLKEERRFLDRDGARLTKIRSLPVLEDFESRSGEPVYLTHGGHVVMVERVWGDGV
ncbi:hypothetical protein B0H67DRAFT_476575, partial [Lasiosphaeris hirsuta]